MAVSVMPLQESNIATSSKPHNFKETPGVKKLAKGYKLLPKGSLLGVSGTGIDTGMFILIYSLFAALIVYAFSLTNISLGWVIAVMAALCILLISPKLKAAASWVLTDPISPVVVNKRNRANLKRTRRLAAQLGESIVPVLKEDHLTANLNVHQALVLATGVTDSREYDRIAVLILEDLSREHLLLDLINNRGLNTMDEIEETLRDIESTITSPVQSGWL
jgi:hypothetical protein